MGIKRTYIGESSRSSYQRGIEHLKEIREGVLDHPLVQHFWEEHGGVQHKVILQVLSRHIKALERQIEESVLIERTSEIEKECLNLKSEWPGTKIPGLRVNNPKGTEYNKEGGEIEDREGTDIAEGREIFEEALRRGTKRLSYRISQKLKYQKK